MLDLLPAGTTLADDGVPVVGGCRLDEVAAGAGTPVLVVAEDALRARAREYADGLAARWPRSRVVFASKAFPATAVQRVVVEEGLGLDVAGGGEILSALKAGVDPRLVVLHGNAKLPEEIALAVEHGLGLVVVDNADDVDRLEATVPAGRVADVLVRVIPGRHRRDPRQRADRPRRLEVRAGARRRRPADRPDRGVPVGADARAAPARRLADPGDRAVRRRGGGGRPAGRVPGLRPRRRARRALHVGRPSRRRSRRTSTPWSAPRTRTCPPRPS